MMSWRKIVLLLAIPGAFTLPAPAQATYYSGPGAVAVYDYNVHLMGDNWQGWVNSIKNEANGPVPDIILGQDFENDAERIQFRDYLSSASGFGVNYLAIGSESTVTAQQRAIFWRSNRFTLHASDRWNGVGGQDNAVCAPGADNAEAIQVRLWDANASKYVAASSFKTPPKGTNVQCAWENTVIATAKMDRAGYNGALHLIGTDANAPDFIGGLPTCWYAGTVTAVPGGGCNAGLDAGWSDPIYDNCGLPGTCLDGHWTHQGANGTNRIDFIFAKRGLVPGATSTDRKTIDKGVCSTYSDHCSVRALISY